MKCMKCLIYRRAHLRDCLISLRDLVPTSADSSKVTTLSLLQSAKQYIKVGDLLKHVAL